MIDRVIGLGRIKEIFLKIGSKCMKFIFKTFVLFFILNTILCKEKEVKAFTLTGITLFKVGSALAGSKPLKLGDTFLEGETLQVESRSKLDFQIIVPKTEIVVRLKEKTKFTFKSKKIDNQTKYDLHVHSGEVYFNVNSPIENDSIGFSTPTAVIGVRGTKFVVQVSESGDTKITLLEGKLNYKPKLPLLESLSNETLGKNQAFKNDVDQILKWVGSLEQGKTTEIKSDSTQKLLDTIGLSEISGQDQVLVQSKLDNYKSSSLSIEKLGIDSKEISPKLLAEFKEEIEDLYPISISELDKPNLLESQIRVQAEKIKAERLAKLEKKYGKKAETFELKSGAIYTGILEKTQRGVNIITPDGTISLSGEEAEEMEVKF